MAGLRILPHREANLGSIDWGTWWLRVNNVRIEAGEMLEGWDYATPLSFEVQPSIDEDLFLESTGIASTSDAAVVALVECASTSYRFEDRLNLKELIAGPRKELTIEPPLGTMADKVTMSLVVVLVNHLQALPADVASQPGARLAGSPRQQLRLEGSAARFPTEAVAFSSLGFPPALWTVQADFAHAEEPFSSAARLLINTDHPRSTSLLDTNGAEHRVLQSALEVDLVRQMLISAQPDREQFRDARRRWPEGSAGAALENLTELFFGKSVHEMLSMQRADNSNFERLLQARLDMFGDEK